MVSDKECKIVLPADCDNSPKTEFLKDFNTAFARGDSEFILSCLSENLLWELVGSKLNQGKAEFARELEGLKNNLPEEIHIHNIITQGKSGSLNGKIKNRDGTVYAFCDVYGFTDTKDLKIKSIITYMIKI